LVVDGQNELQRFDVSGERDGDFAPEGEVICRWRQVYKPPPEKDDSARRQRETAESLFLSLFEDGGEGLDGDSGAERAPIAEGEAETDAAAYDPAEREILKKFLGLLLERKRILRARGSSPDGNFRLMEHVPSKTIYPVPAGELAREELMRISDRLNALIG